MVASEGISTVKMLSRVAATFLMLTACLLQPALSLAVTLGQIDDFQDGTTQNWGVGNIFDNPFPPVIVPNGGPAGAGDHYLLLTADGGAGVPGPDPASRLTVINQTQWAGNYLAAGVNVISMQVRNLGATTLSLRLYVADGTTAQPLNAAISTNPVFLPVSSSWTLVRFSLAPGNLTPLRLGSVQNALANAKELRIFHNPAIGFPGPTVVASLDVDNIKALRCSGQPYLPLLLLDD